MLIASVIQIIIDCKKLDNITLKLTNSIEGDIKHAV